MTVIVKKQEILSVNMNLNRTGFRFSTTGIPFDFAGSNERKKISTLLFN